METRIYSLWNTPCCTRSCITMSSMFDVKTAALVCCHLPSIPSRLVEEACCRGPHYLLNHRTCNVLLCLDLVEWKLARTIFVLWLVSKSMWMRMMEKAWFPNTKETHSQKSCDKWKRAYPLRDCILAQSTTVRASGTTQPVASWFPNPNSCLIVNYAISQRGRLLAIISALTTFDNCPHESSILKDFTSPAC